MSWKIISVHITWSELSYPGPARCCAEVSSRRGMNLWDMKAGNSCYMIILPDSLSVKKEPYRPRTPDEEETHDLYTRLIHAWNHHDSIGFSALFAKNGVAIGFDGTQLIGQKDIDAAVNNIFHDHVTSTYVTKVRDIRSITKDVMILRAVAGMISPGEYDVNPSMNAVQTLLAFNGVEGWQIVLFQNTPAKYDGRTQAQEELTKELRELI